MVGFKTWNDYKKFMEKYATCSCFNCRGFYNGDDEEFKGRFVCMKTLSPIRMDLIYLCAEWEDNDGKLLKDFDDVSEFSYPSELADLIDDMELVTFEELEVVINEYKETIE